MKIGIVGYGFVGKAVDEGFKRSVEKKIIDPKLFGNDISELVEFNPEYTFVCVPTPMNDDGSVNSSIVDDTISFLLTNTKTVVILKSTVTPDIIKKYCDGLYKYNFVYNPEFLREQSYVSDFIHPEFHVFGGEKVTTEEVENLYWNHSICSLDRVFHVSSVEASYIKYGINSYLASKVLWFNQFYDLIEDENLDPSNVISIIGADSRINRSHTLVPGPDGRRGYGGSCFPKDTVALLKYSEECGKELTVLKEVISRNQEYRSLYEVPLEREKDQNVSFDHALE